MLVRRCADSGPANKGLRADRRFRARCSRPGAGYRVSPGFWPYFARIAG
jgi:hypothetical protein